MIKIKEAIIVEGKYDKAKLSSIFDTIIIETDGFGIFDDKKKIALIQRLAKTIGIIIFTDSDSAGFVIRNHIKGCVPEGVVKHAYAPEVYGKEKRKSKPSKEGILGVEGIDKDIIEKAVLNSGISHTDENIKNFIVTKLDFYKWGFSGREDSKAKRQFLLKKLKLPSSMSTNALIEILPYIITHDELHGILNEIKTKSMI